MPEAAAIQLFRRRLAELGCPPRPLRRKVREFADHHDDLQQAATEEGLSEADAEATADRRLGEPVALAEQVAAVLRQSSWWGRHPFVGFCLLPLLALMLMAMAGLALDGAVASLCFTSDELAALRQPSFRAQMVATIQGTNYAMIAFTAFGFFWLARRSATGFKWAFAACGACSLYSFFTGFKFTPDAIQYYLGFPPSWSTMDWIGALIPLGMAGAAYLHERQLINRLAPLSAGARTALCLPAPRPTHARPVLPQNRFFTPTTCITAVLVAAVVALGFFTRAQMMADRARGQLLRTTTWPAERAAVVQLLKARQAMSEVPRATTINLQPFLNASLADSTDGPAGVRDNDLTELPPGLHTFASVPFEVEGRMQLMGRKLLETSTRFPPRINHVPVGRKCDRLHLLHGASSVSERMIGTNIARLVLHYADGSQRQLAVAAGAHVLDWWGPTYQTGVSDKMQKPAAPGSELAWTGSNAWIKRQSPEQSLRLYKTTFDNPQPGVELVSLDYASTLTDAAPFLVALTLE